MAGLTFLRVVSNADLVRQEKEAAEAALAERQNQPVMLGLASYLRACWDVAQMAKKPIEQTMLRALRQRNGEYEADKLKAIRDQGGSEIYMMITEVKCRAAESWLRDILLDEGTPPWDLHATPIPDLSPVQQREVQAEFAQKVLQLVQQTGQAPDPAMMRELREMVAQDFRFAVLQEAQIRADKMKVKIQDQFAQGGWAEAFNDFITDLVTFPAAFVKGPVVRRQRALGWETTPTGATVVKPIERLAPEYERVDPFYIYPEPGISRISDGYLFEYHPLTRMMLADLIGVPGYDEDAIRRATQHGDAVSGPGTGVADEMHPSDYVNDPLNIARNDGIVAVNSALEIDLTGQAAAESIGTRIYSGLGGHADFIRGAALARGGKPILAKGYGFSDYGSRPNTPETLFEIASTSKQFTAAAVLLLEQGYDVVGVFMGNGVSGATRGPAAEKSCCSASDARDAEAVAGRLGIPFYAVDYPAEFGRIVDHFAAEYRRGRPFLTASAKCSTIS